MNAGGNTPDCLVVGGGLVGMLSARALQREGLQVTLLERGELFGEASWAGGGILSPLVPWEYPDHVNVLVRWSQQHYPGLCAELCEETGIDPEWTQSGLVLTGCTADDAIEAWFERFPCEHAELDETRLRALEPALGHGLAPALRLAGVAQARNPRLGKALAGSLRQSGVVVRTRTPVRSVRLRRGRVEGVETGAGVLHAARVVVAGGAWSPTILQGPVGAIPVTPVLGQMIQFEARPGLLSSIVVHDGRYLVPRRDGLVLAGSTLEYTGYDKKTTQAARELLTAEALKLVPALSDYPVVRHWAGLRPGTADGTPLIGEHAEISGLFLNTGHFRNGVVMAPGSARLLADAVCGRVPFIDAAPFVPGRGG